MSLIILLKTPTVAKDFLAYSSLYITKTQDCIFCDSVFSLSEHNDDSHHNGSLVSTLLPIIIFLLLAGGIAVLYYHYMRRKKQQKKRSRPIKVKPCKGIYRK